MSLKSKSGKAALKVGDTEHKCDFDSFKIPKVGATHRKELEEMFKGWKTITWVMCIDERGKFPAERKPNADVKLGAGLTVVYRGQNDDWYWRTIVKNGNIVADGSEGYAKKSPSGCMKAARKHASPSYPCVFQESLMFKLPKRRK